MIKPVKMIFFLTVLGMIFSGDLAYYFNHSHTITFHKLFRLYFFRACVGLFFIAVFHRFTLVCFRLKASRSTANAPWTTKKI